MTTSFSGNVKLLMNWNYQSTDLLSLVTAFNAKFTDATTEYADGESANQAEFIWADRRTVTLATTNDDIDLYGSLTDAFGETLNIKVVKTLVIYNRSTTAGEDLLVGGASSNQFDTLFDAVGTSVATVRAGGFVAFHAPRDGYAVTSSTADVLRVQHDGSVGDITYDILVIGTK